MKKRFLALALSLTMALLPVMSLAEEGFDPSGLIDWFNESNHWMTVANGHWSSDPADRITHEELEKMFSMTVKQQNAVHWTPWFFVVVEDVEEQRKIIGDAWGAPEDMATEGTVTVLVYCDQILTAEEGHVSPYEGYYIPTDSARYDAGLTCGMLGVAAASLGYKTHYFGTINGEYAPKDLADGKYQSLNRYLKDDYQRVWGFRSPYNGEVDEAFVYPVAGNCVFIDAIVIGKPIADETVETWGTNHARPNNWVIWDGVPNEEPSPAVAAYEAVKTAAPAEAPEAAASIELGENEYLGEGKGMAPLKVKLTMDGDKMTAIEIVEHEETAGIGDKAFEPVVNAILEAQSIEVDGVAGATITSQAIKDAVADALAQVK